MNNFRTLGNLVFDLNRLICASVERHSNSLIARLCFDNGTNESVSIESSDELFSLLDVQSAKVETERRGSRSTGRKPSIAATESAAT